MIEVCHARHLGAYRIEIQFSTGESGMVDLTDSLWGPVFEPLRVPERFARFALSATLHAIAWDNDADFAPEYLRDKMIEQAAADGTLPRAAERSRKHRQPHRTGTHGHVAKNSGNRGTMAGIGGNRSGREHRSDACVCV